MTHEILINNKNYEVDKSVYELVKSLRIELGIQKCNWEELKKMIDQDLKECYTDKKINNIQSYLTYSRISGKMHDLEDNNARSK